MLSEPNTVILRPTADSRVVADHLPGTPPAWVFLHGLTSVRVGEKSSMLFDFARARGEAAWRFDFRGHGASSGVLADVTLTELIADAATVLRSSGPALLIGSSLGGLVAGWTAAQHPELVLGLVLVAPALRFLPRLRARLDQHGRMLLPHGTGDLSFSARVLADFEGHDEDAMARAIRQPTLVVHGALDDTVPVDASRELFARLGAAQKELWVLPDGDHRLNTPFAEILAKAVAFHRRDPNGGRTARGRGDSES